MDQYCIAGGTGNQCNTTKCIRLLGSEYNNDNNHMHGGTASNNVINDSNNVVASHQAFCFRTDILKAKSTTVYNVCVWQFIYTLTLTDLDRYSYESNFVW